ncbi:GrpB family protein [Klenkia sp. PcliD-1-E]|nr:GrpB family protein [Klenkia sp. PcliD-1-E]
MSKPVVDIQVSVADLRLEAGYVPQLEGLGLQLRSRDDQHRYFRPRADLPRHVHVHVCRAGSEWERVHLEFRDRLRSDPDARRRYAAAKEEAARVWRDDMIAYTAATTDVILDVLDAGDP